MAKQEKNTDAVDPLLVKPEDTRTERQKFVDEFTERYQDKNPHEQAEAIVWAIDAMVSAALIEQESKNEKK